MPTPILATKNFVAALAAAAALTACSSTDATPEPTPTSSASTSTSSTPTPSPSSSATDEKEPAPAGPVLSVTIDGEDVGPNAEEIDLGTGDELTIDIRSDRAGELHVHSTPEQFVEFDAGTTRARLVIETPGSVEVEEHDTSAVVALITVRG